MGKSLVKQARGSGYQLYPLSVSLIVSAAVKQIIKGRHDTWSSVFMRSGNHPFAPGRFRFPVAAADRFCCAH
jgi:hypothetical protein